MNPAELSAIIRFHLAELGARNAHHEFEHLARYVAKARIASNIVPATGPVSSGGDKGRDFETFSTRHGASGPSGSRFASLSSTDRKLVFACSLEKRIARKIRSDVQKLAKQQGINEVVYFCETSLPVAKRLELIEDARRLGMDLQIFDGNAVAEWLAEPDIFWIAQEYLHLPSEIAPTRELEEGYLQHRERWLEHEPLAVSRADFQAIRSSLRRATFDEATRPDLRLWLCRMAVFLGHPAPRDLARKAMYETAVANLRGKGDLDPAQELITDYFGDVADYETIGDITDAVVLLT